jgi:hypothetical protein
MKEDKIRYLKGNKELFMLAKESYRKNIFNQSLSGFNRPIKLKNRYRKSWSESEHDHIHRPKFFTIRTWITKN